MNQILKLALLDFKLVFRDPSLRAFLVFPIVLFALVVWGLPNLIEKYDFLQEYLPVFMAVALIENTQLFTFISSMVLIDEKETNVAKVYGILPLTKTQYVVSRLLIPYLITLFLNLILFAVQPFYSVGLLESLLISVLTALVVPVYILGMNAIVKNRMEGMVYIKAFNMLVVLPIAAFFVPTQFKHFFGILPTHWIFQSIANLANGLPIHLMVLIGFIFLGALLWFISKQFIRTHFV
ncbi:MAG: fluoroquinolone transport system permease protein [Arenicella sp.]|jgi:fluoroquinolone transport system permease protein